MFTDTRPPDVDGKLRLISGISPNRGRLEILKNGVWGTICSRHFDAADADVACRQMGFHYAVKILRKLVFVCEAFVFTQMFKVPYYLHEKSFEGKNSSIA